MNDKTPEVILSPHAQAQVDADPDLAKAMREFSALARQAMQDVEDGRYKSFDEAMAAKGLEATKIDLDDLPKDMPEEAKEALRAYDMGDDEC